MDELSRIQRGALGLAIGLATLLSGACRTIKIRRPSISAAGEVRVAEPKRAWEVCPPRTEAGPPACRSGVVVRSTRKSLWGWNRFPPERAGW